MIEVNSTMKRFDKIDSPKFSLIIPVYNVEKFIVQCLDSIVNQTLQEFEIICINDGSTDNSIEILNQYAAKDKRFIVISQENQGQGVARNKGLEIAKGEYIVFIDPDDWIELNALEELYKAFKNTKSDVIEFNYREYNDYSGKIKDISLIKKFKKVFNYNLKRVPYYNWKSFRNGCLHKMDMHVWSRAYSNNFIKKSEAIFAPTKQGEDHLFAHSVILNAKEIHYLDKYLYIYRCRNGSAVNTMSNDNFGFFQNCELLQEYLIKHDFYDDLKDEFRRYQTQVLSWHYENIPDENKENYKTKCKEILTDKEYEEIFRRAKRNRSFLEFLFSIKNQRNLEIKYKVITILGIKIKLKPKRKSEEDTK